MVTTAVYEVAALSQRSAKAGADALPGPVPGSDIPPGRPGTDLPHDAVEHAAVVVSRTAHQPRWEKRLRLLPFLIGRPVRRVTPNTIAEEDHIEDRT